MIMEKSILILIGLLMYTLLVTMTLRRELEIRSLNDLDKNNFKKLENQLNMRMEIIIDIIYK